MLREVLSMPAADAGAGWARARDFTASASALPLAASLVLPFAPSSALAARDSAFATRSRYTVVPNMAPAAANATASSDASTVSQRAQVTSAALVCRMSHQSIPSHTIKTATAAIMAMPVSGPRFAGPSSFRVEPNSQNCWS